ncbi:MAG: helix-turn-helix domain-containing protein, partial [Nocardioidaceae bacterium]
MGAAPVCKALVRPVRRVRRRPAPSPRRADRAESSGPLLARHRRLRWTHVGRPPRHPGRVFPSAPDEVFRAEFGLGPKLASRVVRFEVAQRMLRTSPSVPFADVASACGYADHAHMAREFTELAGCTPG